MNPSFSLVPRPKSSSTRSSEDDSLKAVKPEERRIPDSTEDIIEAPKNAADAEYDGSPRDPLNWFGILVPPALRQSQAAFKSTAMENIPALASIAKEMREVELEVRRTRKKLRKAG